MGKLDNLRNIAETQSTSSKSEYSEKLNLPIKLESYEIGGSIETNYVVGKRLDTGEIVKIRLFEIETNPNSKYKRVEIADFSNKSIRKSYTREGCYMVFESATKNPDGTFQARWCAVLDREPEGTKVSILLTSLRHGIKKTENGDLEWFQSRILNPTNPAIIESQEKFDELLMKYLEPKFKGSLPQLNVRVRDNNNDVVILELVPLRISETEDGKVFKRTAPAVDSLNNIKTNETEKYNVLITLINDPDVVVEFIPGAILYPGSATKEKMESQHQSSKKVLLDSYIVKNEADAENESDDEKPRYPEVGYIFTIIATRMHQDGTPYLTYIKPLKMFDTAMSLKTITKFKIKD